MGHYYNNLGEPCYQVPTADGKKLRDTNIRDARKLNLVPSVTEIIKVAAQDGLIFWQQNQILEAVLTNGLSLAGKNVDQWKGMILEQSQKIGKDAAKKGTLIHDALEQTFLGGCDEEFLPYTYPVVDFLEQKFGEGFIPEKSFSHSLGFGGKIDLYKNKDGHKIVIDFKTKADKAFDKKLSYDNHHIQLAAYGMGLEFMTKKSNNLIIEGTYANIFISNETPGKFEYIEYTMEEILRGWEMFESLLKFWKLKNNFNSSF